MGARPNSLVPTRHVLDAGPYRIATNKPLTTDDPAVGGLIALEKQVGRTLDLPTPTELTPIEIYILDDRATFNHFLKYYYPELPPRRAFFFAQGERRVIYAYRGERMDEDLRHEACHALLHGAVGDLPLWLDEGLAEYFEQPTPSRGLNREHLSYLPADLKDQWQPNLERLEKLVDVRQMTPRDYRESWAWVHYLLNTTPQHRQALITYVADQRSHATTETLSERLAGVEDSETARAALVSHLQALSEARVVERPAAPVKIRTQNQVDARIMRAKVEPSPRIAPENPGFFDRALDVVRRPFGRIFRGRGSMD